MFLKVKDNFFRTVIGDKAMYGGVYYWEIWADPKTENELKMGVVKNIDFNLNTSFSDFEFGWAFYGLG